MAKIIGTTEGLVPSRAQDDEDEAPRGLGAKAPPVARPGHGTCSICGGWWRLPRRTRLMQPVPETCRHCDGVFGRAGWGGATSADPEEAAEKLQAARSGPATSSSRRASAPRRPWASARWTALG